MVLWWLHQIHVLFEATQKVRPLLVIPSSYLFYGQFYLCTLCRENDIWIAVFEIAWWTGARDQQKQCRSSKTPVYAGPKDQQLLVLFFLIHIAQILFKTHFKVQNSLVI